MKETLSYISCKIVGYVSQKCVHLAVECITWPQILLVIFVQVSVLSRLMYSSCADLVLHFSPQNSKELYFIIPSGHLFFFFFVIVQIQLYFLHIANIFSSF